MTAFSPHNKMYAQLSHFGNSAVNALPVWNNDPLTYCIGSNASQAFNHGSNASTYGQNSPQCQVFMAQRCAQGWDGVCEFASTKAANPDFTQVADTMFAGNKEIVGLTAGEVLLRNTAQEKFRVNMLNCTLKTEPFDPINPTSPYIAKWVGQNCVPQYAVDPFKIDQDIVMHKILDNPKIAMQMLTNIAITMKRQGTFHLLRGTRLGSFYGL